MPVVSISTARIRRLLGTEIETGRLADAVDMLGCDLEEVAEVRIHRCPSCGALIDRLPREDPPRACAACGFRGEEPLEEIGTDEMVRLDLLPARPDLFDAAGLVRALRGTLGLETGLPAFPVEEGGVVVRVDPAVRAVRPEIVCAEVEMPPLDVETLVESFQLQENLHWAVGRGRKKASIGVYHLDTLTPEITYTAWTPERRFTPLGMPGREMTLAEILAEHPKGTAYAGLLASFDRYPILVDSAGQVLSMPPIINSEETKVAEGQTRLFIDVTGHDRRAVEDCLAILVTAFHTLGGTLRSVRIEDGERTARTPDLTPLRHRLSPARASRLIGVPLTEEEVRGHLDRMRLGVEEAGDGELTVLVPRYRVDVKHEVDLIEDVAIAHGYHLLPSVLVPTMTVGRRHPESTLKRLVRRALAGLGFYEVLNLYLTNREEHLARMRLPDDLGEARLRNPISVHQEIVRAHLLSGLMATFAANRARELPQPVFEIGPVIRAGPESAAQSLHLGLGVMGPRADYADIRSVVESLLHELGVAPEIVPAVDHPLLPVFLPGRAAALLLDGRPLGVMGEVHPEVITSWSLDHPVVLAEVDLDPLIGVSAA